MLQISYRRTYGGKIMVVEIMVGKSVMFLIIGPTQVLRHVFDALSLPMRPLKVTFGFQKRQCDVFLRPLFFPLRSLM